MLISPYTPNYFIPGVDVEAYGEALAFLAAEGWQRVSSPISMAADLSGFRSPPEMAGLAARLAAIGARPPLRDLRPTDYARPGGPAGLATEAIDSLLDWSRGGT